VASCKSDILIPCNDAVRSTILPLDVVLPWNAAANSAVLTLAALFSATLLASALVKFIVPPDRPETLPIVANPGLADRVLLETGKSREAVLGTGAASPEIAHEC
jgi:hypothetical protein